MNTLRHNFTIEAGKQGGQFETGLANLKSITEK